MVEAAVATEILDEEDCNEYKQLKAEVVGLIVR